MRFRSLTAGFLFSGLLLAACDSSTTAPDPDTGIPDNTDNPGGGGKANGTVTLDGRTLPVVVAGLYDDTSMMMTVDTDVDVKWDTGWSFILNAVPGKGTHPVAADTVTILGNTAHHSVKDAAANCIYHFTAGSIQIDAWTETATGKYKSATLSGKATLTLAPSSWTPTCTGFTTQITFTNALAGNLGG